MKERPSLPPSEWIPCAAKWERTTEGEKKVEDMSLCLNGLLVMNLSTEIAKHLA